MACSRAERAKRALVSLLLALAAAYGVSLTLRREAGDAAVTEAFRRVIRKAHPDKGGSVQDAQRLQQAREDWQATLKAPGVAGRPRCPPAAAAAGTGGGHRPVLPLLSDAVLDVADPEQAGKAFRIQAEATMLTYQGFQDLAQWRRLVVFVQRHVGQWRVRHWCATLETNAAQGFHVHLMLQFASAGDRQNLKNTSANRNLRGGLVRGGVGRSSRSFAFEGLSPRVDPNDLGGEGMCKKRLQESINRGMFYVWADKIGTARDEKGHLCVAGNYEPCWTSARFRYQVLGRWPERLWKQRKFLGPASNTLCFLALSSWVRGWMRRCVGVC